jgi:hypothetical protein
MNLKTLKKADLIAIIEEMWKPHNYEGMKLRTGELMTKEQAVELTTTGFVRINESYTVELANFKAPNTTAN